MSSAKDHHNLFFYSFTPLLLPTKLHSSSHNAIMVLIPKSKSDPGPVRRDPVWRKQTPAIPSRKFNVQAIPRYQDPGAARKKGKFQWLKKAVKTSFEGIAKLARKCYPSEDFMRCVKCTYWIVLIIGGIVAAIVAIAPVAVV